MRRHSRTSERTPTVGWSSGPTVRPVTESEVQALAAEAEAGYDIAALSARRPKRGRPSLGSAPATVESVRLDPELRFLPVP